MAKFIWFLKISFVYGAPALIGYCVFEWTNSSWGGIAVFILLEWAAMLVLAIIKELDDQRLAFNYLAKQWHELAVRLPKPRDARNYDLP